MSNLLKFAIAILFTTFVSPMYSQVTKSLRLGANFSSQKMEFQGSEFQGYEAPNTKILPGFNVGMLVDIEVNEIFSVETGMLLSSKGYRIIESEEGMSYKERHHMFYFDVPINAKYTLEQNNYNLFVTAGPYLAVGFFGKGVEISNDGEEETTKVIDYLWGKEEEYDQKRLDVGINIGAGLEIGPLIIGVNYGHGLMNISKFDELSVKNRVFSISIGTFISQMR